MNNYYYILFLIIGVLCINSYKRSNYTHYIKISLLVSIIILTLSLLSLQIRSLHKNKNILVEQFYNNNDDDIINEIKNDFINDIKSNSTPDTAIKTDTHKIYNYNEISDNLVCFITTFSKKSYDKENNTILNDYTNNNRDFNVSSNAVLDKSNALYMKDISAKGPYCSELGINAENDYSLCFYINFNSFSNGELCRLYGNVTTNIILRIYCEDGKLYIDYNGDNNANNAQNTEVLTSLLRIDFTEINFLFTITKTKDALKIYKNNILKDNINISGFYNNITFSNYNITFNYYKNIDIHFYSFLLYSVELNIDIIAKIANLHTYLTSLVNSDIPLPQYNNGELFYEYKCTDQVEDTKKKYETTMNNYYNLLKDVDDKNKQIHELIEINNSHENKLRNINSVVYLNSILKKKVDPKCNKVDSSISVYKQSVSDDCRQALSSYCRKHPDTVGCICSNKEYKYLPDCLKFNKFLLTKKELQKNEKILEIKCPSVKN